MKVRGSIVCLKDKAGTLFVLFFWLYHPACEILDPGPEIKLMTLQWNHEVLITESPGNSPYVLFVCMCVFVCEIYPCNILTMSEDIFGCHDFWGWGWCWHFWVGPRNAHKYPSTHQTAPPPPHTQNIRPKGSTVLMVRKTCRRPDWELWILFW